MRILYWSSVHLMANKPTYSFVLQDCNSVPKAKKQGMVMNSTEWVSDKTDILLIWHSHFDCQMSFCRCPHDVINKASENHMATQRRYTTNSLTAQDITYRILKKANLPPVFSSSLNGLQSTRQRKCQPWLPSCSQTFKWNFIDSCLWTNRTEGADKAFHVHVFCTTRRVE